MMKLRIIFQLILAVAILMALASCGGDEHQELVRPQLSQTALSMVEGDEAYLSVSSVQNVTATVSDENIISVSVSGNEIKVNALTPGIASVKVDADGHWLQCSVTVIDDNKPYSFGHELSDNTPRYESELLSLQYNDDTPGVIFTRDYSNGEIEILSLESGAYIVFNPGCGKYESGALENATLTVNGKSVKLSVAIVEQVNESGVWLNLEEAETGKHIVLVLTGL